MRIVSPTLLAAQKRSSRTPAVSLQAKNLISGVVNLKWTRLYTGTEPDGPHALTLAGDGSLIRLRITAPVDNRKLYRQRVTNPGPGSDFSQWTYLNEINIITCAACSLGSEVSLAWMLNSGAMCYQKSLDYGATWQSVEYPAYAPIGILSGMTAAYKSNGDLAIFYTDAAFLRIVRRTGGAWQYSETWDKTTGYLTGVAAVYDGDWKLIVSGQDTTGNFKVWSIVYGDGNEAPAGTWSALKEMASAPADSAYQFNSPFLDKPDSYRCFYVEKFTGSEAYNRPYWSHTLPGPGFNENRWREPVPFATESPSGLALAHYGTEAWLSMPSGVWQASLVEESLDLSADILRVKSEIRSQESESGQLIVELRNDRGQYSAPGTGSLAVLETGCRINFSPGYRTAAGQEFSPGLSFILRGYEHTSAGGQASLVLYADDGWTALENWIARYQFRWNKPDQYGNPTQEASIREILTQVLARSGIKLIVSSQSATITGFYPDFTIHPGDSGKATINRLLSFVPDRIFLEGDNAYLVNPGAADAAVYRYGPDHVILEGTYRTGAWRTNRVKVEGPGISVNSFAWEEIQKQGDILELVEDLNLTTTASALDRGSAHLRQAEIKSVTGLIRIPVNCGQQLYDVVAITDPRAGLNAAGRRILGITLSWLPAKAQYQQKLELGKV